MLAGGQSLLPVLRLRMNAPTLVIDLGKIESLRGIRDDGDALVIGAMTTHHQVMRDPLVHEHALLLAKATETVADPQIRHRGTFGGSLAHADPAGDVGVAALALEAEFVIAGPGGVDPHRRRGRLLRGLLHHGYRGGRAAHGGTHPQAHRVGSPLREVRPRLAPVVDRGCRCDREGRRRDDHRGADRADQHGARRHCARASVEAALVGKPATDEAVRAAAATAAEGTNPPSDLNGDADYRKVLAPVLTRRAVLAAAGV